MEIFTGFTLIGEAVCGDAAVARALQSGQQDRCQYSYNSNDNKKFYQREMIIELTPGNVFFHIGTLLKNVSLRNIAFQKQKFKQAI